MSTDDGLEIERDLIYVHAGGRDLLCDVYRPRPESNKHLGLVHIHGGGGNGGSKDRTRLSQQLARRGYTSIAIQYRLAPDALWPSQLEDIEAGIAWTLSQAARLDVRADRVALVGYSIGGQMALVAAGRSDGVAACVALYPSSIGNPGTRTLMGDTTEDFGPLNPVTGMKPGYPPTILLHGNGDTVVDVLTSFDYYAALRGAGVPTEMHIVEGVDHGFEAYPEFAEPCADLIDLFIDRHVIAPRKYERATERARA